MTDASKVDPERLAALLDGRLTEAEAAQLRLALAAAGDDAMSAYADAIAIAGELNGDVERHSVRPLRKWRVTRSPWTMAAAAVILAVVVIRQRGVTDGGYQPAEAARLIALSVGSEGQPAWSATRGAGDDVARESRAVRVGALLTNLEYYALRGDSIAFRRNAAAFVNLVRGVTGGPQVIAEYQDSLSGGAIPSVDHRRRMGEQVVKIIADRPWWLAGVYLEAVRLAGLAGDTSAVERLSKDAIGAVEGLPAARTTSVRPAIDSFLEMGRGPHHSGTLIGNASALLQRLAQ